MKLKGELKKQVELAGSKEEIKKLDEEQLEQVAGGKFDYQYRVDPKDFEAESKMKDPFFPSNITW